MINDAVKEAVALAAGMETDGIAFYTKAAKAAGGSGRLMFESLARDEQHHLRILHDILREILHRDLDELLPGTPASRVKTVFAENRALIGERVAAGTGDAGALELAMKMEEEGLKLYRGLAETATEPGLKALFTRLIEEERQHFLMLQNTHSFLTDTGNWFVWEEHGILDGG